MTTIGDAGVATPARRRWTTGRVLAWTFGGLVILGMLISVLLPSLCGPPRESANRVKCASNLRQIGAAIGLYARDHGGQYPPSLAALTDSEDLGFEVLVCPSSNDEKAAATGTTSAAVELMVAENNEPGHKDCLSYVYVGQTLTTATVLPSSVVAYEPLANHNDDGGNVLFGDGHVEWVARQTWPTIIKGDRAHGPLGAK